MHHTANTRPRSTPYWRESDFVAGHVSSKHAYWESDILQDHPSRDTLLGWTRGVRLTEFIDRSRKGTNQGHAYNGADLTPIVELPNHVPQEFDAWVDKEVAALVGKKCIAKWSEVADVSTHPKPNVTLPVGIEPTKPRIICDARYLNRMCEHSEFKMDGVGKVAQCSWQGAHKMFTWTTSQGLTTCLYTQIYGRISEYIGRECITYRPSYVSDGVNRHISTTRFVTPSHNNSATSTCLFPRGLTISGCPTFKQLKLSHPHNNAKRRGRLHH